jgi:hypothetical protein
VAVPLCPEAKLFLAVYRQAALDLRSGKPRLAGEARLWILERGGTFDLYAQLLGLDSSVLRRAMLDGSRPRPGPLRAIKGPGRRRPRRPPWETERETA